MKGEEASLEEPRLDRGRMGRYSVAQTSHQRLKLGKGQQLLKPIGQTTVHGATAEAEASC